MADDRKDYRSLGEILHDAREAAEHSVEDLAQITKIAPKAILAIEDDDIEALAGPIYARSFVRTLAETYHLDVEFMLTKLEHASAAMEDPTGHDRPREDEGTWHLESVRVHRVEEPPSRRWVLVGAALIGLVVVGLAVRAFIGGADEPEVKETSELAPLRATPDPGPPPGLTEGSRVRTPDPEPVAETPDSAPSELATATPPAPEPTTAPEGEGSQAAAGDTRQIEPPAEEEPEAQPPPPTPPAASAPPGSEAAPRGGEGLTSIVRPDPSDQPEMTLVVEARGRVDVWVGADGAGRQRHSLSEGSSIRMTARDHFSLLLSDPRAVEVRLDGVPRTPPPGLRGEWILYPDRR